MANIDAPDFLSGMAGVFATSPANTEFVADALRSINAAINDINIKADPSTQIARAANLDNTIGLDEGFEHILESGVIYYLVRRGRQYRSQDSKNVPTLAQWKTNWNDDLGNYYMDIKNSLDPDVDDIVGLGVPSY